MRPLKTFSLLFAIIFALTLTLPAGADKSPPAPKTEKIVKADQLKSNFAETGINMEAYKDVGPPGLSTTISNQHYDLEKVESVLYLDRPERPVVTTFGYRQRSLSKVDLNTIRPPNKE